MIFKIPYGEEFRFRGDKSSMLQNLIFAIIAKKMLRRGCQGYLAVVRDVEADTRSTKFAGSLVHISLERKSWKKVQILREKMCHSLMKT